MFKIFATGVLIILLCVGTFSMVSSAGNKIKLEDVVSDESKRYRETAKDVASVCNLGENQCILAILGATTENPTYVFKNPYEEKQQQQQEKQQQQPAVTKNTNFEIIPTAQAEEKTPSIVRYSGPLTGNSTRHGDVDHKVKMEMKWRALEVAQKEGIPHEIFFSLIKHESGWNPSATSSGGARGATQLLPSTAKGLKVKIDNPIENLTGGARYLKAQKEKFGSWKLALAAYNAGPNAVKKYKGIPPFEETKQYVQAIADTVKKHYGIELT